MKYYVNIILNKQNNADKFTIYLGRAIDGGPPKTNFPLDYSKFLVGFGSNETLDGIKKNLEEKVGCNLSISEGDILISILDITLLEKVKNFFLEISKN